MLNFYTNFQNLHGAFPSLAGEMRRANSETSSKIDVKLFLLTP